MADEKEIEVVEPQNLTLSQESELNAKAASLEGFEQRMMFETYYKMGESRSMAKLAKQIGRATRTIERWSNEFRWTSRIRERERQAAEFLLMQKSAQEESETKKKHLTLIDASVAQWSKRLVEGKIRLRTVEDLERLIRLRWDIHNIPDKRVNASAAAGSSTIDLRLRNMDRNELQQFLYSTLRSIERVMNKKTGTVEASGGEVGKKKEKMNLDISLSMDDEAAPHNEAPTQRPNTEGVIDIDHLNMDDLDMDEDFDD